MTKTILTPIEMIQQQISLASAQQAQLDAQYAIQSSNFTARLATLGAQLTEAQSAPQ